MEDSLGHADFCKLIESKFKEIIKNEPLLSDLDSKTSLNELKSILSLEHGESMNLFIKKFDGEKFSVIVKQNATLKDLKESIEIHFKIKHEKNPDSFPRVVNWKYVWRNFCLSNRGEKLVENLRELRDCGIRNRSELEFFKLPCKKN